MFQKVNQQKLKNSLAHSINFTEIGFFEFARYTETCKIQNIQVSSVRKLLVITFLALFSVLVFSVNINSIVIVCRLSSDKFHSK